MDNSSDDGQEQTTDNVAVKIDGDEWYLGWKQGVLGQPRKEGSSLSWISGYIEGKAERESAYKEKRVIRLPRRRS